MKESMKKYLGWCVAIVTAAALTLLMFFGIYKFDTLRQAFHTLVSILMPIIIGIGIAYVLAPAYNLLRHKLRRFFHHTLHWCGRKSIRCADGLAMLGTFLGAGALIAGLLALILPQIIDSVTSFAASLPSNLMHLSQTLQKLLQSNPELEEYAMSWYAQGVTYIEQWIQQSLAPSIQEALGYVSMGVLSTVNVLSNILIGIIVAVYLLSGKESFVRQMTRCTYATCGVRWGNIIMEYSRYAHKMFSGFIGGKLIDSFIIFLICCVALPLMNMPYAMLISVIIGVTNIIPFFGPFIGAIPSFIIVLIDSPIKSIYFLIYVLVLQQFDGNILGPKILGDSTGLSSFWVLFSILLFGGLFGFIGMLIGVPVFAILYRIVTDLINRALIRKKLPVQADEYVGIDHFDITSHEAIRKFTNVEMQTEKQQGNSNDEEA